MPDESDDRGSPGDDEAAGRDASGGTRDSDASDSVAENTDSSPADDETDQEPDPDDARSASGSEESDATAGDDDASTGDEDASTDDASADDEDASTDDATADDEDASTDDATADDEDASTDDATADDEDASADDASADDEDASADEGDSSRSMPDDESDGGSEAADESDGGLRKVDPEVEPAVESGLRRADDDAPAGPEPPDGEGHEVPNRGVEAGFDEPPETADAPPEKGPGPGPEPHPDRIDPSEAGDDSDVPVGHAAGAPSPGEATASAAGTGTGTGGGGGGGGGTATGGGYDPAEDDILEGPPDDEEMPLADHIEEMVLRLAAVITVGAIATAIMYLYADRLVVIMWNDILPAGVDAARPHLYGPLEFILTKIKVASLAGVLIAVPVLVYQSYLFMRPGLYPRERRYYLAAVPTSLVLAVVGMGFAYFLVLPGLFNYFLYYTQGNAEVAFGLAATFNLIVALMGLLAVVFQIPLLIMLAIMMGVTTRSWLEGRRLLFWGAFAGIAFLFAPDPTGMAPFIIAITMIVLFEGTLLLLRWTGR